VDTDDDDGIRFRVSAGGRRMSKAEFIQTIQTMDPKSRAKLVEDSDAPEALKKEAYASATSSLVPDPRQTDGEVTGATVEQVTSGDNRRTGHDGLTLIDSNNEDIPFHPVSDHLAHFSFGQGGNETAAQRRRRQAQTPGSGDADDESRGRRGGSPGSRPQQQQRQQTSYFSQSQGETAAERRRRMAALGTTEEDGSPTAHLAQLQPQVSYLEEEETAAERRRRLAALGTTQDDESSSSDEDENGGGFREPTRRNMPRRPEPTYQRRLQEEEAEEEQLQSSSPPDQATQSTNPGVTFADGGGPHRSGGSAHRFRESSNGMRLRWGADVGQKPGEGNGKKK